jgi:ribosomal protein L36
VRKFGGQFVPDEVLGRLALGRMCKSVRRKGRLVGGCQSESGLKEKVGLFFAGSVFFGCIHDAELLV